MIVTQRQVGEERDWWLCIFQPNYVYGHARAVWEAGQYPSDVHLGP